MLVISIFKNPETVRTHGLGNKAVLTVLSDYFYFSPDKGFGFWDVCAPHAFSKEINGGCFYTDGSEIRYPHKREEVILPQCFMMSINKKKIEVFVETLKENNIIT